MKGPGRMPSRRPLPSFHPTLCNVIKWDALTTPLQVLKTCYLEPLALFDLAVTQAVLRWFSGTRSG